MKTLKEIIAEQPSTSYERVEALRGLIELAKNNDELLDYVLSLKNDESVSFRLKWARLLGKFNSPRVAQAFIECLEKEENLHIAKTMIKGLAKSADRSFVELLKPFLEHESYSISHAAKMTIAELEYEPVEEESVQDVEEAPVKKAFPRHKLPWRLKLKFFYRKYKLAIYIAVFIAALFPVSLGVGYSIEAVKELIVSYQPTAEELAEKKRLEQERLKELERQRLLEEERRRLEELHRIKELEGLEKLKNKKPINWGKYLSSAFFVILFFAGAYVLSRFIKLLDKWELNKFQKRYKGKSEEICKTLRDELAADLQDEFNPVKPKANHKAKERAPDIPLENELINSMRGEEELKGKAESEKPSKESSKKDAVKKHKGYEKRVISQSKEILFSIFDRFFRLFNFNYSKNILKIFIPNDLFYKIRFRAMLCCLLNVLVWFLLVFVSLKAFIFFSKSELDPYQLEMVFSPLAKLGYLIAALTGGYGFFVANPFKLSYLNLQKLMSDYYYRKKSYFRKGEKEQWGMLLRHLEKNHHERMSFIELLIYATVIIPVLVASVYFIYLPLLSRFSPDINLGLPMFDWSLIGTHFNVYKWSKLDLVLAAILIFPFLLMLLTSLISKSTKQQDKYDAWQAERDGVAQKSQLKNTFPSLRFGKKFNQEAELRVLCGKNKREWLQSVYEDFIVEFPNAFVDVEYVNDKDAQNLVERGNFNVWMPDSELAAKNMNTSIQLKDSDYLKYDGAVLQTPLVYVFRKSALKKFLDIYQSVNYRSLIDANGTMRNLKELDFSFVFPDFDDFDLGTYNLIHFMNEYFRTTRSYEGDVYKNTVFQRTLKEYLDSRAESLNKNKCSVFVTREKEGIEFIHRKKGRGWQLVYPSMILQIPQKYIILNHSPETIFFYKYLMTSDVQSKAGNFGWRSSVPQGRKSDQDSMNKWSKYNVPNRLGVHSHVPDFKIVRDMLAVTKNVSAQ